MECEVCKKLFSTRGNLLKHQQTAKYCMKMRETSVKLKFICNCGKELSSKQNLHLHQQKCTKYTDSDKIHQLEKIIETYIITVDQDKIIIEELKARVRELELDIKDIALKARGKTTNNANTYIYQNFTPITDEKLKKNALTFTKKHLELGGQGIAHFVLKNSLKDNFTCTDVSRGHTKYIDGDGDLVTDPFSHSITRRVCESLVEPAEKINNDNKSSLTYDTPDSVFTKAGLLNETVNDIKKASIGVECELTREFAKTICANSVKKC
jgi:hypothetical protein